jgi:hypothetical protein
MPRTSTVRSVFSSEVATLEASSNVIVHPSWKIAGDNKQYIIKNRTVDSLGDCRI